MFKQIIEKLNALDVRLFLSLNKHHNAFFDPIMYWASNKYFWVPFYLLIVILIIRAYKKRSILIFICTGILITLSDQLSSAVIKPLVKRLRPSHNPALAGLVHLSSAGPGGLYGFVSGHATNCFALFIFLTIILCKKFTPLKWVLFIWAIVVSYSRIYVGVHYPGDVICGAALGSIIGYVLSLIYERTVKLIYN
jgi:undecaprenyl-diphosphatase